jgi:hypothetical protein
VMHLNDVVLNLFKPTIHEAPPHRWHHAPAAPLLPTAGEPHAGDTLGAGSGSVSFRDLSRTDSFFSVGSRPCIGLWRRARPRPRPRHSSSGLGRRKKIMSRSR